MANTRRYDPPTAPAVCVLTALALLAPTSAHAQVELRIPPIYQDEPAWAWASVAAMVFDYYGVETWETAGVRCGPLALLDPTCAVDCDGCPAPPPDLVTVNELLTRYPQLATGVPRADAALSTFVGWLPLSPTELRAEIDAGRPVVAGLSPTGRQGFGAATVFALVIGYDGSDLIVNDPFPYGPREANPYLAVGAWDLGYGQYQISYAAFTYLLEWRETIYRIRCDGRDCVEWSRTTSEEPGDSVPEVQYGTTCQAARIFCPLLDRRDRPVGSDCYCRSLSGPIHGTVVP